MEASSRFGTTDELWAEIEPLIPVHERRRPYPGRKAIDDRLALDGILHVQHRGSRGRERGARGPPETSAERFGVDLTDIQAGRLLSELQRVNPALHI